jgi:hypothetical protein
MRGSVVDILLSSLISKEGLGEIIALVKIPLSPPLAKGEEDVKASLINCKFGFTGFSW